MNVRGTHLAAAAFLVAALVPAFAQQKDDAQQASIAKEQATERMTDIAREVAVLRQQGEYDYQIELLVQEYARLSARLGGDDPGGLLHASVGQSASTGSQQALLAAPPACGATPVSGNFAGTTGNIGNPALPGVLTLTTVVSGVGPYLWDVNLNTAILHTDNTDIDLFLTSPAGTTVTITTDSTSFDDVFNGTLWDDNVAVPVSDYTFTNLVAATPLAPEGRLEAFRGENPNGTWTLTVMDDLNTDVGSVTSWSLDISTLAGAPTPTTTNYMAAPNQAIPDNGSLVSNVFVSGVGTYLSKVTAFVTIPHTDASDLDISLQPPVGVPIKLTTDNGGANDDVFNGTLFDGDVLDPVTDHVFANLVAATPLAPEGPFDSALGIDPNGIWTLIVTDDLGGDFGTFTNWTLTLTTIPAPTPSGYTNFPGTGGAIPDGTAATTSGTFSFNATVSGMPTYLWDLDVNMVLPHTYAGDLDITLQSPAGTTVTLTTDNGVGNDDVFNGTLWDDNVNAPVTDYVFANQVLAPALSPEGRLDAFRGEDPNGLWTLTVVDDAGGDVGVLNSWSLDVTALAAAPTVASMTFSQSPGLAVADLSTASDSIVAAGLGTVTTEVEVYVEILHTNATDLDVTLTSPAGTVVVLTTDNGGANDNVFNGTLFDGGSSDAISDHTFANNVVVTTIGSEGALANFMGENPNGTWTLDVADDASANTGTLVRWDLTVRACSGPPPAFAFCFGDGSGTACPCGNAGLAGNGCASSVNANGGNLATSGVASIGADTFALLGSGMPNSSALYFQGTTQLNAGMGSLFGDGLRCAGGTVIRLGTKANAAGASQYPAVGDIPISIRGNNVAGNVRTYQCWYRNAAAFCTASTFNLTNGIQATWAP